MDPKCVPETLLRLVLSALADDNIDKAVNSVLLHMAKFLHSISILIFLVLFP